MAVEARAWITGEYPNQKINFELPSGPKGDPGGFVVTSFAGDLNTLETPGVYGSRAGTTNRPIDQDGTVYVSYGTGTTAPQQLYVTNLANIYTRRKLSGVWSAWVQFSKTRVDTTVGERIFITDGTTEKMVSGDTGWRKVVVAPKAGVHSGGEIRWRRSNNTVQLFLVGITLLEGTGFVVILDPADIPFGFRAVNTDRAFYMIGLSNSATSAQVVSRYTSSAIAWNQTLSGSTDRPTSGGLQGVLEWTTDQVWPTELPGTPV